MYRAVALDVLERGADPQREDQVTQAAEELTIDVRDSSVTDGRQFDVLINGRDRTWDIRSPEVNACVSEVSVFPGVRQAMTAQQRKIAERGRVVMLGRDVGTVVLPDADFKIYLEASLLVRATRRYNEEKNRGNTVTFEEVLASVRHRDEIDSGRKIAPLKPAADALIIQTDDLNAEQVVDLIWEKMRDC
jgi:cytidylate kinase